jgi:hypothetical protein
MQGEEDQNWRQILALKIQLISNDLEKGAD